MVDDVDVQQPVEVMSSALLETVGDDDIYDALQAALLIDLQAPTPDSMFSVDDLSHDGNASFAQHPPIAINSRPTRPLIITSSLASLPPRHRVESTKHRLNSLQVNRKSEEEDQRALLM